MTSALALLAVDAPTIAGDLGIDPGRLAGLIVATFYSLSLVLEPVLLHWSERYAVRWLACAALLAICAIDTGASFAEHTWVMRAIKMPPIIVGTDLDDL